MADEVLDQWDMIVDADDLRAAFDDAILVASDHHANIDGIGLPVHVVPCVPGRAIEPGARISGMKVARVDGVIGLYLFAEVAE